jgi:hypothetical protein
MEFPQPLTQEEAKRRKGKNVVVALALLAFVVIVFAGSMAKMMEGAIPVMNADIGVQK